MGRTPHSETNKVPDMTGAEVDGRLSAGYVEELIADRPL